MTSEWPTKPLGELCKVFDDGDWIETKDQSPAGIRLIQTGNVGDGAFKYRTEKARYVSAETFKRLRCTEIFPNDCLISRLPDPVGRSCLLPETGERMITAVDCTIVRFRQDIMLPPFFQYYSQSQMYQSDVDRECTGTTRKRISRNRLAKISIPVPPLCEQQRIVAKLDEAFAAIAKAKENAEKNVANARAIFDSELNAIFAATNSDWPTKPLGETCTNLDSMRVPVTKASRISGDVPYYGASGVVDYVKENIFDEDLLLVSEDGANLLARTYPIAFSISGKSWVNNHAHVLRFEDLATQKFIEFYLNSISLKPYVSGMAQPKLNQKALNAIPVPFPSFKKRQEVVSKLEDLAPHTRELTSIYESKLSKLDDLKKSLLHNAFTGQL